MTESAPGIVCSCELENGYILKNFFNFNALRAVPVITFLPDKIISENQTADEALYGSSYLHGDEIGLNWYVPHEKRRLSLSFDSSENSVAFNRIKKKDEARIFISQTHSDPENSEFDGPESSNEFAIFVSCGSGGDRREGLQRISARRVPTEQVLIRQPTKLSSLLIIPIKAFRQMMDSFSKTKKQSIRVCFYTNDDDGDDPAQPGIMITTDVNGGSGPGVILEKYGEIPEDESGSTFLGLKNLNIDESSLVIPSNPTQIVLDVEKESLPNEFIFNSDKISVFSKLANMHNEGNVRIYYEPGCHLRIAHRFGGFGECEIMLHNEHVRIV